jgi:hypothetical protein
MTRWAEEVARNMIQTREGRREAQRPDRSDRPCWAAERSDEYPPVSVPAVGTARVPSDARFSLIGRAGTLTPLQATRADGKHS